MDVGYIVTGVISALVAIILVLSALLKLYLPKLRKNNPGSHEELVEIRLSLQKLNELLGTHAQMATRDHGEVMGALQRMEGKLK